MKRFRIGILFGGRSGEHEVSLRSAASVMDVIDQEKYEIIPIGITKEGKWLAGGDPLRALQEGDIPGENSWAAFVTDPQYPGIICYDSLTQGKISFQRLDLIFPVLHGPFGEDGTVQGLLEMAGIPYVGSGVLGSAAAMDKVIMKKLFAQNDIPIGEYLYFNRRRWEREQQEIISCIEKKLHYPCFIKPANLGSSVGVSKAADRDELLAGIGDAFRYDCKIIVEKFIAGREIECSVLGNETPSASLPGEIIPCNDFYDYRAKYIDDRSELVIPAPLSEKLTRHVQELAKRSFSAVEASGLARVDFFIDDNEQVFLNEINTMPGFTNISMYPKLWEATGLPYRELIDRLIELALERHQQRAQLLTSPPAFD
ncbi:MAG: D-alanine--D-alanine ligase [Dethiobacteria bacterium]|jgi:D-alanine-D-alanine ligase|nr:D-alanine--D-alanine ligase [Bacillota bacterium]